MGYWYDLLAVVNQLFYSVQPQIIPDYYDVFLWTLGGDK